MKKIFYIPFFALLFFPFCANRKTEHLSITKAEINLYVQSESLRVAVERRLRALEEQAYSPAAVKHSPKIEAMRASDPIRQ